MKRSIAALAIAAIAPLVLTATPSQATNIGYEGCTPGYWKNHTDSWEEAKPGNMYVGKFSGGSAYSSVSGLTQLQALDGGGGSGANGAARILARASMAAYLNAATEGLGYPWRRATDGLDGRPPLTDTVNAAFASGNRDTMINLATWLDADNNLGCPLN
ncbi:hypothetical protein GCM10009623_38330 [Nocardioides aestuarii]|uniref:Uncharacterized protein n=1 Tax=Nocardioides aestuarii TaxID=252231 RepID=A0ABW4TSA1_9ACTN